MIRIKITAIILFIIELACFVWLGYGVFHKVPFKVTNQTAKEFVLNYDQLNEIYTAEFFTKCPFCKKFHKYQKVELTKEELQEFHKTNILYIKWRNLHHEIWLVMYMVFGGISFLISTVILCLTLGGCFERNFHYDKYAGWFCYEKWDCEDCLFQARCNLIYVPIRNAIFHPIKVKWYRFWGF